MKSSTIRSQFLLPQNNSPTSPSANPPFLIHVKAISNLKQSIHAPPSSIPAKQSCKLKKTPVLNGLSRSNQAWKLDFSQVSPNGYSRFVVIGAVSVGFVLFLIGMDDQKALALGPEGPLVEEFWDNMRRYALYILTVSTGVAYTVLQPIVELLKNPITAILILIIIGGSIYIVSQVLSAMVGVTDFSYEYSY
ncbi:hypothetical protein NMG60_11022580 [Bertholletia excelsa]